MFKIFKELDLLKVAKTLTRMKKEILTKVHCKKLKWHINYGLSDAAVTAIFVGIIHNLQYLLYRTLNQNLKLEFERPDFKVEPYFKSKMFKSDFNCIFAISVANIIIIGFKFLKIFIGLKNYKSIIYKTYPRRIVDE